MIKLNYGKEYISDIKLRNGILQGDTMSPLLFIIALDPIIKEIDRNMIGIRVNKDTYIKKLVYMDDLKVYVNEKESPKLIDDKIIALYKSIGMKINSKKVE